MPLDPDDAKEWGEMRARLRAVETALEGIQGERAAQSQTRTIVLAMFGSAVIAAVVGAALVILFA